MHDSHTAPDTAARSLSHWSEAGRTEMEAFYALARLDYDLLSSVLDWEDLLTQFGRGDDLTLLDVACGSGKFPSALVSNLDLSRIDDIRYDLLDPSAFSLREAAAQLHPPFAEGDHFETTLEDLPAGAGPWNVVWATHALYALDPAQLPAAVARYRAATAPDGISFLAQGSSEGHYLKVYAAFLAGVRDGSGTQYVSSEDLIAELRAQGADPAVRRIAYDHVIAADNRAVLEGYLQRCLFDDTITLDEMLTAPILGPYLASQFDADAGTYRFHQEVDCVVVTAEEGVVKWKVAS